MNDQRRGGYTKDVLIVRKNGIIETSEGSCCDASAPRREARNA